MKNIWFRQMPDNHTSDWRRLKGGRKYKGEREKRFFSPETYLCVLSGLNANRYIPT